MKHTREALGWLAVFSLVFMLLIDAGQAATQLDTTFGENGLLVKDFGNGDDEIFALAPQTDGNIVVAGYFNNGAVKNLVVARYLPTGQLDTEFNDDGIFTHSMGSGDTAARNLVIQSDGMIVVAGSAVDGGDHNIAVIRLTKDGFLDNTFAANGQLLVPISDGEVTAYEVKTTAEGAIFVAGTVTKDAPGGTYGIVLKLTAAGQPDEGFGNLGVSLVQFAYDAEIRAAVLQADGKLLTAGSFAPDGTSRAGLLRLNEDGTIDESFGEQGQLLLSLSGSGSTINDITLDSSGRMLVAGDVNNGSNLEIFVGRLNTDGSLDSTFADSGIFRSTLTTEIVGKAITLQANGAIWVVGYVATATGKDVYLLTLEETTSSTPGTISATFNNATFADSDEIGNALAVMPDGSILVAGSTGISGNFNFLLMRFLGEQALLNALSGGIAGTTGGEAGVTTAGYTLVTKQVTAITRVGAKSGGIITDVGNSLCADSCEASCSADPAALTTCVSTCTAACQLPTVTRRGVVFGINENPVLDESDSDGSSTDDSSTDDNSTDDSSIDDNSTNNSSTNNSSTNNSTIIDTSTDNSSVNDNLTDNGIFPESGSIAFDIVRSGQTEDGSGTGSFDSVLEEITPNTRYHLRAYAVLSDGTVIYGNEVTFKTDDACFIATAAFGSILDRHVTVLREFRDRVLMVNLIGQRFVGMYYSVSPRMADVVEKYEALRALVCMILIPVVLLAYFILKTGLVTKVCFLAVIIGTSAVISRKTQKTQVTSV